MLIFETVMEKLNTKRMEYSQQISESDASYYKQIQTLSSLVKT